MRYDQSGLVQCLYDIGHGEGLSGTCNPQQSLELIAFFKAFYKGFYGLGLVAGGLVFTVEFERFLFSLHKGYLQNL